jgi:hypothetical protein
MVQDDTRIRDVTIGRALRFDRRHRRFTGGH